MEPAAASLGRVLVIDDDELAKSLLKGILERAGFSVWALLSPVGATQLIGQMGIQVAVVDVAMPVVTGDRLARLLRTWEPFKHLAIVLVSGMQAAQLAEVARGMPDVSVVTKARVQEDLPRVVRKAIAASTRPAGVPKAPSANMRLVDANDAFLKQLPGQMTEASELWEGVSVGKQAERGVLRGLMHTLKGRSDLLGYEGMSELFATLLAVVAALPTEGHVDDGTAGAVRQTFRLVAGLARAPTGSLETFDPGATLEHLRHIQVRLQKRP